MAKWTSPREQRERATAKLVAQYRPVVDRCAGASRLGELVIVKNDDGQQRVLVCIGTGRGWDDDLGNTEWHSDLAEPSAAEMATPDYQRMSAKVAAENAREAAYRVEANTKHEAARSASLSDGHEPTLYDDLFAGTEDDDE